MFQHRGTSLSKQYETCIGAYKIVHMENTAICLLQKTILLPHEHMNENYTM